MGHHLLPGNPPVALTLRRSARARRISLRVSALDGRVTLTMPNGVPDREALDFARQKEAWLSKHLASRAEDVQITHGAMVPFEGIESQIVPGSGRMIRLTATSLEVPGTPENVAPRLGAWLKQQARNRLVVASDDYAAQIGRRYNKITLRDTRSRWGSCSSKGALMFSWRLILSPPDVLRYVAAHEVAHLAEMNHSPAFWAVVTRLYGPWEVQRRWLHDNGSALHAYRFDP